MRISLNWLSEFVDLKGTKPEALAEKLTDRGLEVEAIERMDEGFEEVRTVRILKKSQHPNADRLSLCQVTDGKKELEIVCGAKNMKDGDIVALAGIGAKLPNGMEIKKSEIRGVVSNGMLCSESELGLSEESEGILILPEKTPVGRAVAKILGREDTVFELGITPNRGDCLSHIGVAREVAAALGRKLKPVKPKPLPTKKSPIQTKIHKDGPQFFGCLIEGVKVGPSPNWVVQKLEAMGSRSINNIVDATNLVLFELGQPTHAYDADLLSGKALSIRDSKKGEKLRLLDEGEISLDGSELVISDGDRPVALAGVMGGAETAVQDSTTRIFLECAEFDPVRVRKAAQKHQRITDACQRFEKGINFEQLPTALSRLAHLIVELAGGKTVGTAKAQKKKGPQPTITVAGDFFSEFLGMDMTSAGAKKILKELGCQVGAQKSGLKVTPPSWRPDLRIAEDLSEEIARSVGYSKIPSTIPPLSGSPGLVLDDPDCQEMALIDRAKESLVRLGFLEGLQFAFSSQEWLGHFDAKGTVRVENPLSEEQEVMVPSLVPGLVKMALENLNRHFGSDPLSLRLFELRPTFHLDPDLDGIRAHSKTSTGIKEVWKLAGLMTGQSLAQSLKVDQKELDFFDVKAVLESLADRLGARGVRMESSSGGQFHPGQFHPGKSVKILAGKDAIGSLGLLHPGITKKLKSKVPVWIFEWDWEPFAKLCRHRPVAFKPWSQHPTVERDFALTVRCDITAEQITRVATRHGKPLAKVVKVFDIYRGSQVPEGMTSVAVRVIFSDEGRSLKESEADEVSARILDRWKEELGAQLRS